MKKVAVFILIIMSIFIIAACSSDDDATPEADNEASPNPELTGVIVVADIDPDDPTSKIERFQPLADYLAANLSEFGIGSGEVRIASDTDTMGSWMADGEVHLYYDSLFPALVVSDQSGAIPILRRWRDNSPVYHSVFFTRADSGIETLDDLKGTVVAYDDTTSTSGYLLPTAYLITNGFSLVEVPTLTSSVDDEQIGYFFTGDDDNTIEFVLSNQVTAGVIDNLAYLDDIPEETRDQLVIIAETDEVARQVVLVSASVDPELREALIALMVDLFDTEEGKELLDHLRTDRFDEFPDGADAALESMRVYMDIVTGEAE